MVCGVELEEGEFEVVFDGERSEERSQIRPTMVRYSPENPFIPVMEGWMTVCDSPE